MNYYLEQVQSDSRIPAKIYVDETGRRNNRYPLHYHDNLEFDLVIEGTLTGRCNGVQTTIRCGDFFFVNSGDLHETFSDTAQRVRTVTVLLSHTLLGNFYPDVSSFLFVIPAGSPQRIQIQQLLLRIGTLYSERRQFFELEITIALESISLILLSECRVRCSETVVTGHGTRSLVNIKKVVAYLQANYAEDISLGAAASEVNMTPAYFSRFFKKQTGETFCWYLSKIRAYHASVSLSDTARSVTDIALDCGFLNVKAFIESFRKIYGETPARWRRDHIPAV
jgi:AraC family transcriptional regulator, melibiose operon regulatory protein